MKNNLGNVISILVTVAGGIFFIIGCTMHATSFGGDFYTYVYQGLAYIVQVLAFILMAIGLIANSYFVMKNKETQKAKLAEAPEQLPSL